MTKEAPSDIYSDEETKHHFEAARRGAREAGHEPMRDIPQRRPKLLEKPKPKAGASPKKRGRPKEEKQNEPTVIVRERR